MWLDFDIFFTLIILIFFLSGEDLKCSFTHLRTSHFKIFSDHGGGQRFFFGHIWGIFLQFLECFKCNFSHFRTSNSYLGTSLFKIFPTMVEDNGQCFWWYGLSTAIFLSSESPFFGSCCVSEKMPVCLSGLRLERLENHHLFLDNLVEKGWKTIPKFIVFD